MSSKKSIKQLDKEGFKAYLERFLPNVMSLFKAADSDLLLLFERFESRYAFYEEQLSKAPDFFIENSLIDLIWFAEEGRKFALDYLAFIDSQCSTIIQHVDEQRLLEFRPMMKNLFLNFDNQNSRIQSYVGEMCVIAKLVGSKKFRLISVESRLDNGNEIDFLLSDGERNYLVEVENIDISGWKVDSQEKVKDFIWTRANRKADKKFAGATVPENTSFMLAQVLWGDLEKLIPYQDVFRKGELFGSVVALPMYVSHLVDQNTKKEINAFIPVVEAIEMKKRRTANIKFERDSR